jgi:hypothetical protein
MRVDNTGFFVYIIGSNSPNDSIVGLTPSPVMEGAFLFAHATVMVALA